MNVRRHSWVYPIFVGFFSGVLLESLADISFLCIFLFTFFGAALFAAGKVKTNTLLVWAAFGIFAAVLGIVRTQFVERSIPQPPAEFFNTKVVLEGVVITDPDVREASTKLTIAVDTLNGTSTALRILATVPRHPSFSYGDRLELEGTLKQPEIFSDDGVHFFNYPKWLLKDGIIATITFPHVLVIEKEVGNPVWQFLYEIKKAFIQNTNRLIAEPASGLLAGLLVGSKQALGEELKETFQRAGVIHVVVLSGYNMTIVASAVLYFLSFLPFAIGAALGAVAMILFVIMVGASATAVRATLMALLVLVAQMTGRESDALRILLIAAFFMVLHNPFILAFDPSFQLSFLATLGLIVFSPRIAPRLSWVTERFGLKEIVSATLATQLLVLPFLIWMNGLFSIVSLPVNLLILPFVPPAMLLGFLAGLISFISPIIAIPFAFIAELVLGYQLFVVNLFASFPFAAVSIPALPFWLVILIYAGFAYLVSRKKR